MKAFGLLLLGILVARGAGADDQFERQVRPILSRRCVGCHGPAKQEGGLRLDSRPGWEAGGRMGKALIPGDVSGSLLLRAVRRERGVPAMPPDGPLASSEVKALEEWARRGAPDPRNSEAPPVGRLTLAAARRWWAYRPLSLPSLRAAGGLHPIDFLLQQRLAERGLTFRPPADRRTLIRRVTYDLTGLPPTSEEVRAFESDPAPGAYDRVVQRLLGSGHYGERWGRHWLDLVRYADTAGENSDHPLPHAWRYRNWVIESFNRDLPYDQFVRMQIAGDLLARERPEQEYADHVIATGFLALARRFGHDIDKDIHLTHEDGIDTIGRAFLGQSLGCARCHDHKYDPISMRDYYALYGILDSTRLSFPGCEPRQQPRDLVPLLPPATWARTIQPHEDRLARATAAFDVADREVSRGLVALTATGPTTTLIAGGLVPEGGEAALQGGTLTFSVRKGDLLRLVISPGSNHGADSTLVDWKIAAASGTERWDVTADALAGLLRGNPLLDANGRPATWWFLDGRRHRGLAPLEEAATAISGQSGLDAWRAGDTPSVFVNSRQEPVSVWTRLPGRSLFAHPAADGPVAIGWLSPVTGPVVVSGRLRDAHPGGPDGVGWRLERLQGVGDGLMALASALERRVTAGLQRDELLRRRPTVPVAFGVAEAAAHDAPLQLRGDPEQPGERVPRRWLELFGSKPLRNPTESGRRELADWLTTADHPLAARVMMNRIWLHHFGRGIVATPNDFGSRGTPPTHPELLDWLASEFIRSGWSIKQMHRLILSSRAYQQASSHDSRAAAIDPANRLYWRFERRRLTAEELRDTLLQVGGTLDASPGQAHPFPPEATWNFTQHVPFSNHYETNRRSVYLVTLRNRRHPFFALFDGADPNASTPQRQATTVPTQALYFMNDPLVHAQAERLVHATLDLPGADRVQALYRRIFQRSAAGGDHRFCNSFLSDYAAETEPAGWSALIRILLASNEFLYLD